ncbi:L,D-transpeptidase [Streptoalloteichus hindustanus]|uniref:Lipoprotein-anchoring transpeptidase ErfK/SrfK n=1 Tax=Streptoalloteichus hindustanus TaxID=2017 RepID=A0A1M5BD19_STRHI|nr:Ig-like domain-containing protein [Streptoalloteichus hindustanus]SHF40052.1 Lipoprotein-anchoring transpeptidase ErfK/SrfK [Streptoalloteichus hindustanus]
MLGERRRVRRWVTVGATALAAVALAATMTSCSGSSTPRAEAQGNASPASPPPQPAKVAVAPANGAADVAPVAPVKVDVVDGTITEVALTNQEGKQVKGTLAPDKKSWVVGEPLGYGKSYTWTGNALGADGKPAPITGSFTTVKPARTISASVNVGDHETYGIAMPIMVNFSAPVPDKAAVQKAMTVESSVPTEGAWGWMDNKTAVWRPKEYWKPGTQVTAKIKLYGVPHGNGVYGAQDVTSTFTIGRSQVVQGNTSTHRMVVLRDGQQIADYPASYGADNDPGRVTRNGRYWVMSRQNTVRMKNDKYNYDVVVNWGVQLSYNGEYVHAYDSSAWAQGSQNVSHGCVNLTTARAKEYFDGALVGDPVEITGSAIDIPPTGNDIWAVPWDMWVAKSAA